MASAILTLFVLRFGETDLATTAALFASHRFFIAMDSAFRPASVRAPFLTAPELWLALAWAPLQPEPPQNRWQP